MTLIIVIIVALLLYVIVAYNGMIKLKNRVKEAWADIDVQLKRRYNLIPNIVETVKGYASHEEGVLTQVTEARANAINATNVKDQGKAENMLAGALKTVFAVAENYPDLKANQNFLQLQNELVDTEDKIQSARRFYNSVTRDFNTKIQQVPAKFIANAFKFKAEEFFEVEDEEQKENVKVGFNKEGTRQAEAPAAAVAEEKTEAPAAEEPKAQVASADETSAEEPAKEEKPAEPAKCPKCGGEMTEGHVCPVKEEEKPVDEPKADEPKAEEPAEEEKKEEPKAEEEKKEEPKVDEPEEEEKKEEPKVDGPEEEKPADEEEEDEKEEDAATEEEKPADEPAEEEKKDEPKADEPKVEEEKKDEQTAMPLGGEGEDKPAV